MYGCLQKNVWRRCFSCKTTVLANVIEKNCGRGAIVEERSMDAGMVGRWRTGGDTRMWRDASFTECLRYA